ncbi:MAG: LysR family transcriptional regulator [Firmicutes bacterium]|nr:LysR family transcriptional regulator [Bacillota bacterium]
MDIRQLEYFVAVADHHSVTKGAASLFVSQPTVSQQIRALETEVGQALFVRTASGVELTDAGETLLRYALRILQNVQEARNTIQGAHGLPGTISLGVLPTLTRSILPHIIRMYYQFEPLHQIGLLEGCTQKLLKLITTGDLQLAIVDLPVSDPHLAVQTLWSEELIVIAPHSYWLPPGPIDLAQLRNASFITMEPGYGLRDALFRISQKSGFNPHITFELTSLGAIVGFVQQGFGISVVPERTVELEMRSRQIRFCRLVTDQHRDIGIIWRTHRPLPAAATSFIDFLRRQPWLGSSAPLS